MKDILTGKLVKATAEATMIGVLLEDANQEEAELPKKLVTKDAVLKSIIQDSCAILWSRIRGFVGKSRSGLNEYVSNALRTGSIDSQFDADTAMDGIILHVLKPFPSGNGRYLTTGDDVADPEGGSAANKL